MYMKCTLLGTGTAVGMPALSCDCDFCKKKSRKRPSLIVEKNGESILFDASPDISRQLNGQYEDIKSVFLTHHHHDHSTGLMDLNHLTIDSKRVTIHEEKHSKLESFLGNEYDIYMSNKCLSFVSQSKKYLFENDRLNFKTIDQSECIEINGIKIQAVSANHCDGYLSYIIKDKNKKVFYHPDFGEIKNIDNINVDYSIIDASSTTGCDIHTNIENFKQMNEKIESNVSIGTNISEHLLNKDTEVLSNRSNKYGIKIVNDGYKF